MRQLRPPTRSGCPSVCPAPPARKPGFGGPSQPPGGLFRKPSVQERHGDSDVKDHAALRTARVPSGLWLWSPAPHVAHGARPGPAGSPRTRSLLDPAGPTPASSAPPTAGPEETRPSRAPGPRPAPHDGPAVPAPGRRPAEAEVPSSGLFLPPSSALNNGTRREQGGRGGGPTRLHSGAQPKPQSTRCPQRGHGKDPKEKPGSERSRLSPGRPRTAPHIPNCRPKSSGPCSPLRPGASVDGRGRGVDGGRRRGCSGAAGTLWPQTR